ncbi:hypothetical protein M0813_15000 [Anaeramoeba flamelloides]|uniref:PAS domain-containing protein n=1 Tax=Anaeramoeba flamelloides TaxID=1746091 RepID=A0ABQ8Z3T7_9EUKA|nr:hypothetical protein M0813_15000 [Anaeramoeba flamelloides]
MGNGQGTNISAKKLKAYKKLCNKSNEAIYFLDESSQYKYANKAAANLLGIKKPKDLMAYNPTIFSPKHQDHLKIDSGEAAKKILHQVFSSKEGKIDFIWQHQLLDGKKFYVHVYLTMIKVEDKSICQAIARKTSDPKLNLESSDNPIDSRLINIEANSDDISSSTQLSKKISTDETTEKTKDVNVSFLDVGEIELEKEFRNFSETVKQIVRANNDPTTERKVTEAIQEFSKLFDTGLKARDKVIIDLSKRSNRQRKEGKTRYRELENHLQTKLVLVEKLKIENENYKKQTEKLKLIVEEVKKSFDKQKKIERSIKKYYSAFENKEEK